MKKMINRSHVEGLLYEHTLDLKQSGPASKNPGANFIRGTVAVEIEPDNVVSVEAMEMEFDKNGKKNSRYETLSMIMAPNATSVTASGREAAMKLRIDSALDVNDWYNNNNELVSILRNNGGFIHAVSAVTPSATFEVDMLITSTNDEMVKDETGTAMPSGALFVNGFIFNFKNEIMPVKLLVENEKGVEYFRNLDANTFTKVWGKMSTQNVVSTKTEASAFGDDKVVVYTNARKKFSITGANAEGYAFGEDNVLTVAEVQSAIADRNVKLETLKNQKTNKPAAAPVANVAKDNSKVTFKF